MDKALLLQLLANAVFNSNAVDMNNNPMIDISADPINSISPQFMDMSGNISFADTSRGMGENGMPLVDWQTHNINELGDENTPELKRLFQMLKNRG